MLDGIRNNDNFNFLKITLNLYGYSDRIAMIFIQNLTCNECFSRNLNKLRWHQNAKTRKKLGFVIC